MLNIFRTRGIANAVYGVVIIATILVFVIQFRPDSGKKTGSCTKQYIVSVRGADVDQRDYYASLRLLAIVNQQFAVRLGGRGLFRPGEDRLIATDGLVERELLVAEAERLGLTVSEKELNEQLYSGLARVSLPARYGIDGLVQLDLKDSKTKEFDVKGYKQKIKMNVGVTEADFREEQRRELLASKMRDTIRAFVRVSEPDAYREYVGEKATATVDYIDVRQSYVKKWLLGTPTDEAVAAWASKNQEAIDKVYAAQKDADLPKEGRIRHILVGAKADATPEVKAAALRKISEAAARIKKGEAFSALAREMSEDPGSQGSGGKYEKDQTEGFVPEFKDEMNRLKPGEISSGVVRSQFGYHLIMKDDPAKPEADLAPAIKRGIARVLYVDARSKELAKEYADKVILAIKGGKSADDAVKEVFAEAVKNAAPKPVKDHPTDKDPKTADLIRIVNPEPAAAPTADAGAAPLGDAGAATTDPKPPVPPKPADTAESDPDRPRVDTSQPLAQEMDALSVIVPAESAAFMDFAFHGKEKEVRPEAFLGTDGYIVALVKDRHVVTREDFEKGKDDFMFGLLRQKQAEALGLYVAQLKEAAEKSSEIAYGQATRGADGGALPAYPTDDDESP